MAETKGNIPHPIPLYAVAMNQAIASGDLAQLQAARDAAFDHLANADEVRRLLPELDNAIRGLGGPIRPLYAVTIQDALKRGDRAEIARLRAEVDTYRSQLGGSDAEHTPLPPYGVAIQDAKARGDEDEVRRLTARAESLLAQLNAGQ